MVEEDGAISQITSPTASAQGGTSAWLSGNEFAGLGSGHGADGRMEDSLVQMKETLTAQLQLAAGANGGGLSAAKQAAMQSALSGLLTLEQSLADQNQNQVISCYK